MRSVHIDSLSDEECELHVSWIADAEEPILSWVFGTHDDGVLAVRNRSVHPASETWVGRIVAAYRDEMLVGGFIACGGLCLRRAMTHDITSLLRARVVDREVIRGAYGGFPPPPDTACVLSRIGVLPYCRGEGVGAELLDLFVRYAARTHELAWLNVCETNERAIRLYKARGFAPVGSTLVAHGQFRYLTMSLVLPDVNRTEAI